MGYVTKKKIGNSNCLIFKLTMQIFVQLAHHQTEHLVNNEGFVIYANRCTIIYIWYKYIQNLSDAKDTSLPNVVFFYTLKFVTN